MLPNYKKLILNIKLVRYGLHYKKARTTKITTIYLQRYFRRHCFHHFCPEKKIQFGYPFFFSLFLVLKCCLTVRESIVTERSRVRTLFWAFFCYDSYSLWFSYKGQASLIWLRSFWYGNFATILLWNVATILLLMALATLWFWKISTLFSYKYSTF